MKGLAAVHKQIRLGLLFLLAFTCAGGAVAQAEGEASLGYLKGWVGHYPQVELQKVVEGKQITSKNLWEDPNVLKALTKTLGAERVKALSTGWGQGNAKWSKIAAEGDNIAFFGCKMHDCYAHQATVFINMKTGAARACWRDEAKPGAGQKGFATKDFWLGAEGEAKVLASESCNVEPYSRMLGMFDMSAKRAWPWEKWLGK